MSKKKKLTTQEIAKPVSDDVPFRSFFQECLTKKLVKPWQENEIRAFFSQLGLRDKEPSDKYRDALAKY